jgi:hypothetical protein
MIRLPLLLCLLFASPVGAQDTLSAAEFDAFTKGKTLFYGTQGAPYGAEVYHDNRRVQWSFLDGECIEGEWYEEAGNICFVYENMPDPQCWTFSMGADGLIAQFESNPQSTPLYDAKEVGDDLLCLGPKVGV